MSIFTTGSLEVRNSSDELVFSVGDSASTTEAVKLNTTIVTGSFRVVPSAGSTVSIMTGSLTSTGAKLGVGVIGEGNTNAAVSIYGDLGITDTASSKTIAMAVSGDGSLSIGATASDMGIFKWNASPNSVLLSTVASNSYQNELYLHGGRVSIGTGTAAASEADLEVGGTNKAILVGDNQDPPAANGTIYLGNPDTMVMFDTFLGGQLVLMSTASIALAGNRTPGVPGGEFAYLKARNSTSKPGTGDTEDVNVEAPGGLKVEQNLSVTGSIHTRGSETPTRIVIENETSTGAGPIITLTRIDGGIAANNTLGAVAFYGSEDNGVTKSGGAMIGAYAADAYSVGDYSAGLKFYTTRPGGSSQYLAMTLDEVRNLTVENNIVADGSVRVNGGSILDPSGNSVIQFDSSGDITLLSNGNITDRVFFQKSETDEHTAAVNIFNTDTASTTGGSIKLATKHAVLLDDEVVGNVLFAAADTDVSAAPVTVSKIESRIADPGIAMATSRGSNLSFYSTRTGGTTLAKTHEMSTLGLTGSVGGLRLRDGGISHDTLTGEVFDWNNQSVRAHQVHRCHNNDVVIQRVTYVNDSTNLDTDDHGWSLVYSGSGSGNLNSLAWWSDGQASGTAVKTMEFYQNGDVFIGSSQAKNVKISGRRERKTFSFQISTADSSITKLLPLGYMTTAEDTKSSVDQDPQQWYYCFVPSYDGRIEAITIFGDTGCGQGYSVSSVQNTIDMDVYIQSKTSTGDLSGASSPNATFRFAYGYNSATGTAGGQPGIPLTVKAGETYTAPPYIQAPSVSDTVFNAGDKIWIAWDPASQSTTWKYRDGSTSSLAKWVVTVHFVYDDAVLDNG